MILTVSVVSLVSLVESMMKILKAFSTLVRDWVFWNRSQLVICCMLPITEILSCLFWEHTLVSSSAEYYDIKKLNT